LVTTGQTSAATQHNTPLQDIETALTACIKANGSKAFTAEQLLFGNPSNVLGAAPKQYVDATVASGVAAMKIKGSVLCATTGNISLSAEQTLDGQLTSSSRVLVRAQTAPAENGIYVTGSGAWTRATDMDAWATEVPGAIVAVEAGTQWADTVWLCTADTGGTLNTTAITWRRIDNQQKRNAQTGTTYTVLAGDHNKYVTHSNGSAIATTLPQATGNFGDGFQYISHNLGAGANTITPTTSTINGAATLVQKTDDCHLISSDGTNYRAIPLGLTYTQVTALTQDGTGATGDFFVTEDVSAGLLKKVLLSTLQTLFAASQAQMEAASSNAVYATPGRLQNHPGVVKAWATFVPRSTNGTCTLNASHNITSVTRSAAGTYDVVFTTNMSSANYAVTATSEASTALNLLNVSRSKATTGFTIFQMSASAASAQDVGDAIHFVVLGDQ
jgi:hypothetical protein